MDDDKKKKYETMLYFMEKMVCEESIFDWLEPMGSTIQDWDDMMQEIAEKLELNSREFYRGD